MPQGIGGAPLAVTSACPARGPAVAAAIARSWQLLAAHCGDLDLDLDTTLWWWEGGGRGAPLPSGGKGGGDAASSSSRSAGEVSLGPGRAARTLVVPGCTADGIDGLLAGAVVDLPTLDPGSVEDLLPAAEAAPAPALDPVLAEERLGPCGSLGSVRTAKTNVAGGSKKRHATNCLPGSDGGGGRGGGGSGGKDGSGVRGERGGRVWGERWRRG